MAACESLIVPVNSVNEVARHPYLTRDCLILIFQSKTACGGFLPRQARLHSLEVSSLACPRLVQERDTAVTVYVPISRTHLFSDSRH